MRKNKKRVIVWAGCVAALTASIAAGCGGSETNESSSADDASASGDDGAGGNGGSGANPGSAEGDGGATETSDSGPGAGGEAGVAATSGGAFSGSGGTGGDGGTGASGGSGGGSGGSGTSFTGPASPSSDGALTNRPDFTFDTSGDLVITTAYFEQVDLTSFSALLLWGDVENRGTDTLCTALADLSVNGQDVLTVINAPAYRDVLTVSAACIAPGASGVFNSIENDIPVSLLDGGGVVEYSFSGLSTSSAVPHPAAPVVVAASVGAVEGGFGVSGTLLTTATPIYNFAIDVYARDVSGLLFADMSAFPGDLATLPISTELAFETGPALVQAIEPIDGPFDNFELYMSFIDESVALGIVGSPPAQRYAQAQRERLAARDAARERLRAELGASTARRVRGR